MSNRRKILAALITLVATIALSVSAYLTWVTWQSGTVAGCTAESLMDCDEVLTSQWSKWFGVPVSLLGGLTYLAILALCWPAALRPQGWAVLSLFGLALLAVGAAIWFVGLQAIKLESYCYYCLAVHLCGLAVSCLSLWLLIDGYNNAEVEPVPAFFGADPSASHAVDVADTANNGLRGVHLLVSLAISATGMSALMGGQLLSDPPETMVIEEFDFQPQVAVAEQTTDPVSDETLETTQQIAAPEKTQDDVDWLDAESTDTDETTEQQATTKSTSKPLTRRISYAALPDQIEVTQLPMLGDPQAEHVVIEMMDYTCKHCRHLHPHLLAAVEHFEGKLAIAIQHTPLSKKCNPNVVQSRPEKKYACDYAQMAIGVWQLAPENFPEYHEWLMEGEKPPNITKAKNRAMELAGFEVLTDRKRQGDVSRSMALHCSYLRNLKSGLPVLLLTNGAIRGVPEESEKLFELLRIRLEIEP